MEALQKDPVEYTAWAEKMKGTERVHYPHVTGTGREIREGKNVPMKVARDQGPQGPRVLRVLRVLRDRGLKNQEPSGPCGP